METHAITNHQDLQTHITALKMQKLAQEESLKANFQAISHHLQLDQLIENTVNTTPAKNRNNKIPKAGLNVGTEFLIDQIWGRHHSIFSFVSAFATRRLGALLINNTQFVDYLSKKILNLFR